MGALVEWSKLYQVYEAELNGIYDTEALDEVLSGFHVRFTHYATREVFHKTDPEINDKVRARYQIWADKCEAAMKETEGSAKMRVIDNLIYMVHRGGFFGTKLVRNFNVFKEKLKTLEDEMKGSEEE